MSELTTADPPALYLSLLDELDSNPNGDVSLSAVQRLLATAQLPAATVEKVRRLHGYAHARSSLSHPTIPPPFLGPNSSALLLSSLWLNLIHRQIRALTISRSNASPLSLHICLYRDSRASPALLHSKHLLGTLPHV